jgi:hypothetical protein
MQPVDCLDRIQDLLLCLDDPDRSKFCMLVVPEQLVQFRTAHQMSDTTDHPVQYSASKYTRFAPAPPLWLMDHTSLLSFRFLPAYVQIDAESV